jgi:signal recognition particle subunit SEC65
MTRKRVDWRKIFPPLNKRGKFLVLPLHYTLQVRDRRKNRIMPWKTVGYLTTEEILEHMDKLGYEPIHFSTSNPEMGNFVIVKRKELR